jgi:hypothetical protein
MIPLEMQPDDAVIRRPPTHCFHIKGATAAVAVKKHGKTQTRLGAVTCNAHDLLVHE